MNFVAIDFETATPHRNSACALGIAIIEDFKIVEERKYLIQPPDNEYDPINSMIHGITEEDTAEMAGMDGCYDEIFELLNGANVVAHNSSFDMSVLRRSLEFYDLEPPQPKSISCTYRMSGMPLPACCEMYGIELKHHDPVSDAIACAKLYMKLRDMGIEMPIPKARVRTKNNLRRETLTGSDITNRDSIFYGKKVVITGVFDSYERTEIADAVQALGASVATSVSKNTDILIRGKDCGPAKLTKAFEFGVEIIDEDYLLEIL